MTETSGSRFPAQGSTTEVENGLIFTPKFDADGLIPAIVTARNNGEVVMFAWMNQEALQKTIATRNGHFWSRSRSKIWRKGEDSGNTLEVQEIRVDCDQDVVWLVCDVAGRGLACHTGARSCFYRKLDIDAELEKGAHPLIPVNQSQTGSV